jgi:hypothetical protein
VLGSTEAEQLQGRLRDRISLTRIREETADALRELRASEARLTEQGHGPAPDDLDYDWLVGKTVQAQEKEREAAAHFRPVIAVLRSALKMPDDRFEAEAQ